MDDVLGQAQAVAGNLREQGNLFDNVGTKLDNVAQRFPMVRGLLAAIRRKKNKVTFSLRIPLPVCCPLRWILVQCQKLVVNSEAELMHAQDTIILSVVIITCSLFTLLYWWNK